MQPLPHVYTVTAQGSSGGNISLDAANVPALASAAPAEFGGPGDQWSPESLLAGAVAGCFILTFRAAARASKLEWTHLGCSVEATLDRLSGVTQFTRIVTRVALTVPAETPTVLAERTLEKAEAGCLVANSLRCGRELQMEIVRAPAASQRDTLLATP
jgi:organic hydroperoxide reductase OsmC/OhrA